MPKHLIQILIGAILFALNAASFSGGFQISETSVSGLGRAFAGNGVAGDDIADMFANPAGLMLRQGREFSFAAHALRTNAGFEDSGTSRCVQGATDPECGGGFMPIEADGKNDNGGGNALVPNFYYAADLSDGRRYGLAVVSPFGLTTEYDENWIGRYAGIKSELITLEVNPNVAWQINERLAFGAGLSILKADAELTRAQFSPGMPDGKVSLKGDDTGIGFTLGFILGDERARFGAGYRSEIDLTIEGTLNTPMVSTVPAMSHAATADITLPQTLYLSGMKQFGDNLDLFATLRWTGWRSYERLTVKTQTDTPLDQPQNYDNSTTLSVGFNYDHSHLWTWRGGVSIDNTPVDDAYRTVRVPDSDRTWLSLGGSYQASPRMRIDFAYAHIFTDDARLNENTDLLRDPNTQDLVAHETLTGTYTDTDADILSATLHITLR